MKRLKNTVVAIIIVAISAAIIKIQCYPFGFKAEEELPNTSINRYKVDIRIHSKKDFVDYLKANTENYELGSFMDLNKNVDWNEVLNSVDVRWLGWKKVYSLEYRTLSWQCNGYRIDMTDDGYILDYRSAGK